MPYNFGIQSFESFNWKFRANVGQTRVNGVASALLRQSTPARCGRGNRAPSARATELRLPRSHAPRATLAPALPRVTPVARATPNPSPQSAGKAPRAPPHWPGPPRPPSLLRNKGEVPIKGCRRLPSHVPARPPYPQAPSHAIGVVAAELHPTLAPDVGPPLQCHP
jgi:hypothetical protein